MILLLIHFCQNHYITVVSSVVAIFLLAPLEISGSNPCLNMDEITANTHQCPNRNSNLRPSEWLAEMVPLDHRRQLPLLKFFPLLEMNYTHFYHVISIFKDIWWRSLFCWVGRDVQHFVLYFAFFSVVDSSPTDTCFFLFIWFQCVEVIKRICLDCYRQENLTRCSIQHEEMFNGHYTKYEEINKCAVRTFNNFTLCAVSQTCCIKIYSKG